MMTLPYLCPWSPSNEFVFFGQKFSNVCVGMVYKPYYGEMAEEQVLRAPIIFLRAFHACEWVSVTILFSFAFFNTSFYLLQGVFWSCPVRLVACRCRRVWKSREVGSTPLASYRKPSKGTSPAKSFEVISNCNLYYSVLYCRSVFSMKHDISNVAVSEWYIYISLNTYIYVPLSENWWLSRTYHFFAAPLATDLIYVT